MLGRSAAPHLLGKKIGQRSRCPNRFKTAVAGYSLRDFVPDADVPDPVSDEPEPHVPDDPLVEPVCPLVEPLVPLLPDEAPCPVCDCEPPCETRTRLSMSVTPGHASMRSSSACFIPR
jgi:hypothetical protein